MNSRERVIAALRHEPVDRIAMGEFAVDFDTVQAVLGRPTFLRNKADSQIALWEGRRDEVAQSWREDFIEFYRRMDCFDILNSASIACGQLPPRDYEPDPPRKIAADTWEDSQGCIYKYSDTTHDITMVHDPHAFTRQYTVEQFSEAPLRQEPDPSVYEVIDATLAAFAGERFMCGQSGGECGWAIVGGMERGLMMFIEQPEVIRASIAKAVRDADEADRWSVRPGQDGAIWGADFAYKAGPMISPAMWHDFCLPAYKHRVERMHEQSQLVIKHACGNNLPLLDDFFEAGFDCYQSLQASAGVDLAELMPRCQGRMALWGGLPLEILQSGSTDDVRRAVRQAVEVARRSAGAGEQPRGFIFGTSHSVAVGTPYDNFMAMVDEFTSCRDL